MNYEGLKKLAKQADRAKGEERKLWIVKTIHLPYLEMEYPEGEFPERYFPGHFPKFLKNVVPLYGEMWTQIRRRLNQVLKRTDPNTIKLYAEGHCAPPDIKRLEKEKALDPTSCTLKILVSRGAKLQITENLAAYRKFPKFTRKRGMRTRDMAMAKNIDSTLDLGETGILFVGANHDVERFLPKDISVKYIWPKRIIKRIELADARIIYGIMRERFGEEGVRRFKAALRG